VPQSVRITGVPSAQFWNLFVLRGMYSW